MMLKLALLCPLCDKELSDKRHSSDAIRAKLFGFVEYSLCPHCLQEFRGYECEIWQRKVDMYMVREGITVFSTSALVKDYGFQREWLRDNIKRGYIRPCLVEEKVGRPWSYFSLQGIGKLFAYRSLVGYGFRRDLASRIVYRGEGQND